MRELAKILNLPLSPPFLLTLGLLFLIVSVFSGLATIQG